MSSPRQALILRYPILAGVPPGGSQPYVDATALIAFGRLYHTHYNALAYSFLSVARVLPLLHVPRFPFHDSTGFETGGARRMYENSVCFITIFDIVICYIT